MEGGSGLVGGWINFEFEFELRVAIVKGWGCAEYVRTTKTCSGVIMQTTKPYFVVE